MAQSFYIFGGDLGSSVKGSGNTIAAFSTTTKEWKKLGEMNRSRYAHGVFIQEGDFIVVGGYGGTYGTERCILNEEEISCTLIDPELDEYCYYPEMMAVGPNYCPK